MNERERFLSVFKGEPVDRPPLLDDGVREEVITRWRSQGMPADKMHLEIFGLCLHENTGPDIRFSPNYFGKIMNLSARDYHRAFTISSNRFPENWNETVKRLEIRDHIVCIWASRGFFQALGVGDWITLKQVLMDVRRHPQKIQNKLEIYGDFCAGMLEKTLKDVSPEFIFLGEAISDNHGPLISPAMFERFMIPVYIKIIQVAKAHGCEHILVSTYGNTAKLLPMMIEAGVTILWVSEAGETPEMDYKVLRHKYGPVLGLIGGIPLSVLQSKSQSEMKQRIHDIVLPLMESGYYIPLTSGRVREDIPWPVYKNYREILSKIIF